MVSTTIIVARGGEVISEVLASINELPGSLIIGPTSELTGAYVIREIVSFQVESSSIEKENGSGYKPYTNIFALVRIELREPDSMAERISAVAMMGEEDAARRN